MLDANTFVVRERVKLLSSRNSYDILDESGALIGTAEQRTGGLALILGSLLGSYPTRIDFFESPDHSLVFTVRRRGYFFPRVELLDADGAVVGSYYAKAFSLAGGFHVYDAGGDHVAEIRGKLLRAEYTFYTPDGDTEMGRVSKQWAGLAKELFTTADTYGVRIAPGFEDDPVVKMLILGAAVAIDALMGDRGDGEGE